jgi:hypothetical protein
VEAERAHEAVGREAAQPRELGHAPGGDAAVELELEEAILGDREALPEAEVLDGARLDAWDAEGVAGDRDGRGQALDGLGAARLRQRRAQEPVPQRAQRSRPR